MANEQSFYHELFNGLKALAETSFPKTCANCGRTFESVDQYLSETQDINAQTTGLKQSEDDDGTTIVEVFRNCPCGSTLMDFFNNRRDPSQAGEIRRKKFDELLGFLIENGFDRKIARQELVKVMRGEKSGILAKIRPAKT